MPKQYIESAFFGKTADVVIDESTGATEQRVIENTAMKVGWSREAYVEVAVVPSEGGTFNDLSPDAKHMQLDRAGINALIRTLRKARDLAFGQDA